MEEKIIKNEIKQLKKNSGDQELIATINKKLDSEIKELIDIIVQYEPNAKNIKKEKLEKVKIIIENEIYKLPLKDQVKIMETYKIFDMDKEIREHIHECIKNILEDGSVDINDVKYIIVLTKYLADVFDNKISLKNITIDVDTIIYIIQTLVLINILPYVSDEQFDKICEITQGIMMILKTVICPLASAICLC